MSSRILLLLIALLPAWIVSVQAHSLGDEVILSRLGDPVEVEIEVRDWQNIELSVVQVASATPQQYEAFGLLYQPLLDTLSFNVVGPNLAGEVKILVSSREPANEPFLELLLVLRWSQGSSLREYVLLFDQPLADLQLSTVKAQQPAVPVAVTEPAPLVPEPVESPPVQPTVQVETVAEQVQPRPRDEAGRKDYRVQNGDTRWTIASQFQPAGIADNMHQFVLSLHDINPALAQQVFDQRWLDATRAAQLALEPEPPQLPVINAVEEVLVAEPVAVAQAGPELPLGTELPDLVVEAESTLLAPSTALVLAPVVEASGAGEPAAVVVAEQTVSAPLATPAPAVQPVPLKVVVTATTTEPTPQPSTPVLGDEFKDANAALRQITDRATAIRDLLQTRQQRLVDVEQQILVLKSQLQQAEARASQLVQELPLGADVTSQAVMLGLLAAVLLIALAATAISALRWNRELQTPVLMMAVQSRRR